MEGIYMFTFPVEHSSNLSDIVHIDHTTQIIPTRVKESRKISWKDASHLCAEVGGFLPHFTTKDDMEELISLLTLSQVLPPVEAIYIGLSYSQSERVSLRQHSEFVVVVDVTSSSYWTTRVVGMLGSLPQH